MTSASPTKSNDVTQLAINTVRFLSVDAVEKANSGHPGTPMALAPIGTLLFTEIMRHNPKNPDWANRDRFVLSAGHASMLLYSLLHLTGYKLSIEEIKNFRQWESQTPGHPEYGDAPGIETTTGPLGQGIATAVGMAIGQKYLNSLFTPDGKEPLLNHKIYGIASDGDMMEGIGSESASLAGHLGLANMIFFYDDNRITIDGSTDLAFSEDVGARFKAYNWNVLEVKDGEDLAAIRKAVKAAQEETKRPTLIITRTHIGIGSPKQDTAEAHGSPLGAADVKAAKKHFGWPDDPFHVPDEVKAIAKTMTERGETQENEWRDKFSKWSQKNPELAKLWRRLEAGQLPDGWLNAMPDFEKEDKLATRAASGKVINALAPLLPELIGGSADLAPSNNTSIKGSPDFSKTQVGRVLHFGVREHAMAAALNGMALTHMLVPFGGTFLIFADYMKGGMRITALTKQRVVYVLTHDSIGLGEDGPTHQPIEHLAHLRAMPNSIVIRPADANETVGAWHFAIEHKSGPVMLILSRQNLPVLKKSKYPLAGSVNRGAYILSEAASGKPQIILIATGSEVSLALAAQAKLLEEGIQARVVSMPSWEIFMGQSDAYRETVLPKTVRKRLAIEAASPFGWEKWTGDEGDIIGMTRFGASAPGPVLMEKFGFSVENVVKRAKKLIA